MSDTKGMTMTVLCRRGDLLNYGPTVVLVVGVLSSHDQTVGDDLPAHLRVTGGHPQTAPVLLDVRALHQTTEQRQVVAVPAERDPSGQWCRIEQRWTAGGAYVVADDSRLADFLHDLSGYAYEPAVPLHDRNEG